MNLQTILERYPEIFSDFVKDTKVENLKDLIKLIDTYLQSSASEEEIEEASKRENHISTFESEITNFSLIEVLYMLKTGIMVFNKEYQRLIIQLLKKERDTGFMESILKKIQIPMIYVVKRGDKLEIVDGQHRLETIFALAFAINNSLAPLKFVPSGRFPELERFEGWTFKDFTKVPYLRDRIFNTKIIVEIVSDDGTNPRIAEEIYTSLNSSLQPMKTPDQYKAAYGHTDTYKLAEELASSKNFKSAFTINREIDRVQYASELIAFLSCGLDKVGGCKASDVTKQLYSTSLNNEHKKVVKLLNKVCSHISKDVNMKEFIRRDKGKVSNHGKVLQLGLTVAFCIEKGLSMDSSNLPRHGTLEFEQYTSDYSKEGTTNAKTLRAAQMELVKILTGIDLK